MTTTLVRRPARIAPPQRSSTSLTISTPPTRGQAPPAIQGLGMLMMPLMSGTGSVTIAISQRNNPIITVAAFLGLLGSIAIGVVMIVAQRSGTKRQTRDQRERYLDYIEAMRHAAREQIAEQRAEQAWRFPRTDQLLQIATDDTRRWERRPSHEDFLSVRWGTGTVPLASGLDLDADTGPLNDFDPVCLHAAQELQHRYEQLSEQPITTDLRVLSQISVIGRAGVRRMSAMTVVAQLAALHSPNDLQIAVVRSKDAAAAWDWVKWLPHVHDPVQLDGDVPARRVAASVQALTVLLEGELEQRLDRASRARGGEVAQPSHLVVVIDGEGLTAGQHLTSPDASVPLAQLGVHVISLLDHPNAEPESVDHRVEVSDHGTLTVSGWPESFRADVLPDGTAAALARQLSALRLTRDERDGESLTQSVGLPEILGVSDPAALDLRRTWKPRAQRDLLRVPIGVGATGKPVLLDIKESAHGGMGPHGLVVGATGSGKSEMLRTLVASLVIGHAPERLALMLVDFKGGATFAPLEGIPHLAGMITNLQDDLTLVDRMRDALYGEMQRRQEILKKAGNLPNVSAYQARIDAGEDLEPLPHLMVIVDEFSELLTAKPDFAELFVAIGRIGRSIGVHLLLASQKLETGKIRGLESHLSYRIGLRTFSESESRDAIGSPDAYHLPPEPGGGYLRVDTTVFDRFKAAMVSDPYVPPADGPRTTVPVVPFVATNGLGAWISQQQSLADAAASEAPRAASNVSVLDTISRQLAESGRPRARQVWLDPLPALLPLSDVVSVEVRGETATMSAMVGRVDDAAKQRQFALEWDFTGGRSNLAISGSPATGKSVLLATLVSSLCLRYPPNTVAVFAIDYGGGMLQGLRDLPHVATVASRTDPELIGRTINDVMTILDEREDLFREYGLTSMRQLREARADGRVPDEVPGDVFLIVDGWGTFREEYDHFEGVIGDIAARGQNFGVHVVISITQSMQIRMRMQAAFGGQLSLRMNDVYDAPFDRDLMKQIGKDAAGRGVTDIDGEHLFQAALPRLTPAGEDDAADAGLPEIVRAVTERWGDRSVTRVETLPAIVREADIGRPDRGDDLVPIGLSEINLGPAGVDLFGASPHLLVLGDGQTGKTNTLRLLIRQLMATRTPEEIGFIVIDYKRALLDVVPEEYRLAYVTRAEDAVTMTNEMTAALRERIPGDDVTSQQLRDRSWWKGMDVVIVADDFDLVVTSQGNPLQGFAELIPQARDLGFHLVIARPIGGYSRASFDPILQRLTDIGTPGVMFSGDRGEGRILHGVAPGALPLGRAYYVARGGASQIQVALTDNP